MWPVVWYLAGWFAIAVPFAFALVKWAKAMGECADRNAYERPCKCCGAYGQKPASVQAPVSVRVISPVPQAPKKWDSTPAQAIPTTLQSRKQY